MDFPSASNRSNRERKEREKLEPIVKDGGARAKRQSTGKRLKETFIHDDGKSVGEYILFDVLIPAAQNMIYDGVTEGLSRTLFGSSRPSSNRIRPNNYTNYGSMGRTSYSPNRAMSQRSRREHDFDEIVIDSRDEAEEVLDRMRDLVDDYGVCTVADLYDLAGITAEFVDETWGWDDFRSATVRRTRAGYLLDLPRPKPVDK